MKPSYPEHHMYPDLPDEFEICRRCRKHVLVYLGVGSGSMFTQSPDRPTAWCFGCSETEPGIRVRRLTASGDQPHQ